MTAMTATSTTDLVELALAGDQRAWGELVERYTRLVWHVILGFRQLDPETQADVHQTTWLKLAEQLGEVRDPERLGELARHHGSPRVHQAAGPPGGGNANR